MGEVVKVAAAAPFKVCKRTFPFCLLCCKWPFAQAHQGANPSPLARTLLFQILCFACCAYQVAYYGWLTYGYIGWRGVLAVFGFFWASAALQR